ncbi:MAG TPA: lysylphosphatidylglycerol synthase transmembrane domain-containing protein [Candidatus Saccharimonadales bacterium]|nr:lysylphosphatidylglycerol synthase transmembrane domain-containing protein [Candidatus Saccharimonadales bacterium]
MPKSKKSFLKRNWKLIVNVLTVAALVGLVFAIREQIIDTFNNLAKVNVWVLLLMLPLQALNYHAQTRVYQSLFGLVGNKLRYKAVLRVALELNFVNHVFPSGGVSGISYFGLRMKGANITGGKATIVQLLKLILLFISFEILLIGGLLVMALDGRASNLVVLAAGSLSTLLVVGTFAFVAIIGSERRIHGSFRAITQLLNRVIHFFRASNPETIKMARIEVMAVELHKNYKIVESNIRQLKGPFFWSFVANLTEVLTVYVVYVAFGEWVNIGAVILAYAVANFAGLVSVLPGGVGIYEALMTGVLAAAGVKAALSLPVTVMFRVLSTLIQLPPGYLLYHQTLRRLQATPGSGGSDFDSLPPHEPAAQKDISGDGEKR